MTNVETLVRRAADRMNGSVLDVVRALAFDKSFAIEHEMRTKDAVTPTDGPLTGRSDYWQLYSPFATRAALPQLGGIEVPFATRASVMTEPPTARWVGRGNAKPVTAAGIEPVTLAPLKVSTIVVLSKEQVRWSGERADDALRLSIAQAAASAINTTLVSDAAAVQDESPAGLAEGVTPAQSSGLDDAAIFADVLELIDGMRRPRIVASLPYAVRIRAALGAAGELLPVVAVPEAGSRVLAVDEGSFAYALGAIAIDASENAALQMDTEPSDPANIMVSMFQTDSVALRVSVFANWEAVAEDRIRVLEMEGS